VHTSDSRTPAVIPKPREIQRRPGAFSLTTETSILADHANQQNAVFLRLLLSRGSGFPLPIKSVNEELVNAIRLSASSADADLGPEGYRLDVSSATVDIAAPEPRGVFYGIQTLRQLLPASIENPEKPQPTSWHIPCVVVIDAPRFAWRGHMLDEGRHFLGKSSVLRTLDLMAMQKLNVFHWHLTDDQGWRIEIQSHPRLTQIGAHRAGTASGPIQMLLNQHDGIPHGGFYTQEDIREIVAYASDRHITVVPEIEMPGHSRAALAAYPELSCRGHPLDVGTRFGPCRDVFCAGKDSVFSFLEEVLDEVLALFPSPNIHIGGDEVLKARWKKCPDCQRRIAQQGLATVNALQPYFTERIAEVLASHGRRMIGWNEILRDGLREDAIVQYWIGRRGPVGEALENGRDVIISSYKHLYLDHSYSLTPLSKAYAFDPVFPELSEAAAGHVMGLEAPLWTEYVTNEARQDFQTYPRLTAFAETGWTPRAAKDYEDFRGRLEQFQRRLDALGVGYARRSDVEPSRLRQSLGPLSIVMPQSKTAGR
jgi:hexosaminidase